MAVLFDPLRPGAIAIGKAPVAGLYPAS